MAKKNFAFYTRLPDGRLMMLNNSIKHIWPQHSIISQTDVDGFIRQGYETAEVRKVTTRRGYKWLRVETAEQRAERRAKKKERWQDNVAAIPGRIALPIGFNGTGDGNCGIVALSLAARVPYHEVFNYYGRKFIKNRAKWKGRTNETHYPSVLAAFGAKMEREELSPNNVMEWRGKQVNYFLYRMRPDVTYMVFTYGHVFIARNGYYIDQRGAIPRTTLRLGGEARIQKVFVITSEKDAA